MSFERFPYVGRDSEFAVHRAALDKIRQHPKASDAIALYMTLLDQHGHKRRAKFALSYHPMYDAGHTDLSRERFRHARKVLEEVGVLQVAAKHVAGSHPRLYRLRHLYLDLGERVEPVPDADAPKKAKKSRVARNYDKRSRKPKDDGDDFVLVDADED